MTFNSHTGQRLVVGTLAAVGFVAGLLGTGFQLHQLFAEPAGLPNFWVLLPDLGRFLAWPAFAGLGLLIVWLSPKQSGALFGVLFLCVYAWWGVVGGNLDRESLWFLPLIMLLDFLFHTSALRFAQLFPRPLQRADVLALGTKSLTRPLASFLAALLKPRVFWPVAIVFEALALTIPRSGVYTGHVLIVSLLAATFFYAGYKRGSEAERQRIFWLMEAAVVFLAVELIFYALNAIHALQIFTNNRPLWGSWLHVGMVWATLLCIALAIFYRGAFDSRLVLRRTTVASAAGAVAVVIFITMETAVSETLEGVFGFQSRVGTISGGVAVALLLRPITERIDRKLGGKGKVVEAKGA
ncbi:MAG: hypothetical protein E4G90_00705 [Gemmatimonadales bacterium]|nr:MAG: hypothetical protein E4G90_00705 [Gemmatimonadales bacterium]